MTMTTRRTFLVTTAGGLLALACAEREESAPAGAEPSVRPLRLLVLGGTGFIGPKQIRYARERGHTVTMFNRGQTNPDLFPNVELLRGDRDGQLDALRDRQWDAVIDNSGFYPRQARDSAALLEPNVGRYLFVSSISAYGPGLEPGQDEYQAPLATMDDPADESDAPYGPTYGARKALCEREVIDVFGEDRSIVVRPGVITGPGDPTDRFRHWIARCERGGEFLVPGTPADPVQTIDARDLSEWMVRLIEQENSGIYNGVGLEEPIPIGDLVGAVHAETASMATPTYVPAAFLAAQGVGPALYMPWVDPDGPFRAYTRMPNARALATGLTYRPLADTTRVMVEEYGTMDPEARSSSFVGTTGLPPEEEQRILAAYAEQA